MWLATVLVGATACAAIQDRPPRSCNIRGFRVFLSTTGGQAGSCGPISCGLFRDESARGVPVVGRDPRERTRGNNTRARTSNLKPEEKHNLRRNLGGLASSSCVVSLPFRRSRAPFASVSLQGLTSGLQIWSQIQTQKNSGVFFFARLESISKKNTPERHTDDKCPNPCRSSLAEKNTQHFWRSRNGPGF